MTTESMRTTTTQGSVRLSRDSQVRHPARLTATALVLLVATPAIYGDWLTVKVAMAALSTVSFLPH